MARCELHVFVADQVVEVARAALRICCDCHQIPGRSRIHIRSQERCRLTAGQADVTVGNRTAFSNEEQVNIRWQHRMSIGDVDSSILCVGAGYSRSVEVVNQHRTRFLIASFRSRRDRISRTNGRTIYRGTGCDHDWRASIKGNGVVGANLGSGWRQVTDLRQITDCHCLARSQCRVIRQVTIGHCAGADIW